MSSETSKKQVLKERLKAYLKANEGPHDFDDTIEVLKSLVFQIIAITVINQENVIISNLGWLLNGWVMVRYFIILHDLMHRSMFSSERVANMLGQVIAVYTVYPAKAWKMTHGDHHHVLGNINQIDYAHSIDVNVKDYEGFPWWKQISYRITRDTCFYFLIKAPFDWIFTFTYQYLIYSRQFMIITILNKLLSFTLYVYVFPSLGIPPFKVLLNLWGMIIVLNYIFHIHHSVNSTYKQTAEKWNQEIASLQGSSCFPVPFFLKPFFMGIQYHHLHHLNSRVPGYKLEMLDEIFPTIPGNQDCWKILKVVRLDYTSSWIGLFNTLYDEQKGEYVPFSYKKVKNN